MKSDAIFAKNVVDIYCIEIREKSCIATILLMKSISQSNTRDITPHVSLTRLKFYFILNINRLKDKLRTRQKALYSFGE